VQLRTPVHGDVDHGVETASELGGSVAISMTHTRAMAGAVAMVGQ